MARTIEQRQIISDYISQLEAKVGLLRKSCIPRTFPDRVGTLERQLFGCEYQGPLLDRIEQIADRLDPEIGPLGQLCKSAGVQFGYAEKPKAWGFGMALEEMYHRAAS